ncbi:MAG: MATE family efflux transporter [Gammaproteobacteria bacterium]|nr:MATE family efflux transporter [Gammaproteobacteria bacterium]
MTLPNPHRIKLEFKRLTLHGLPLVGAQVLGFSAAIVDSFVAGKLGPTELAAGGTGGALLFIFQVISFGMVAGLAPWLGQLLGQRRPEAATALLVQGHWFALLLGAVALSGHLLMIGFVDQMGFEPAVTYEVKRYLWAASLAIPFSAMLSATKAWFEVSANGMIVVYVQLIGIAVNLFGNFGLGLGMFGLPKMGMAGIGLTTALVHAAMAISILWFMIRGGKKIRPKALSIAAPQLITMLQIGRRSLPIFTNIMFETSMFIATALLIARVSTIDAAAHTIAANVSALCFMIPLGLSQAVVARVALAHGRQIYSLLIRRIQVSILAALVVATATCLLIALARYEMASIFTDSEEVRELAAILLIFAALFQLSDSVQVTLNAILRALNDTTVPMLISGFGYWAIGVALGALLDKTYQMGAQGYWIGLLSGLTMAAVLLTVRLVFTLRQTRKNYEIPG